MSIRSRPDVSGQSMIIRPRGGGTLTKWRAHDSHGRRPGNRCGEAPVQWLRQRRSRQHPARRQQCVGNNAVCPGHSLAAPSSGVRPGSSCSPRSRGPGSAAPLPLAGHAIVVAVHFHPRAVHQEVSRFGAGSHLRAIDPAIAAERRRWVPIRLGIPRGRPGGSFRVRCIEIARAIILVSGVCLPADYGDKGDKDDILHEVSV